jgi:hypothetical protein
MTQCPNCQYDAGLPDAASRVVCPECGFEYLPGESMDAAASTRRSGAAAAVFTIVLAAMVGLIFLSYPMSDTWFVRDRMRWWYLAVLASIGVTYVLTVRLFPELFVKFRPSRNPVLTVYLLLASGLYAVIAMGLLWLRGIAAQS